MIGIPRPLYARIERELHAQPIRAARDAQIQLNMLRDDMIRLKSPALDGAGMSGGFNDRVQQAALRVIEAERMLEMREKWADVVRRLDEAFAGTKTMEVAHLLYTDGKRASEISRILGVDRQTVNRRRDEYVTRAALLAAERGLIRMSDYTEDRRDT